MAYTHTPAEMALYGIHLQTRAPYGTCARLQSSLALTHAGSSYMQHALALPQASRCMVFSQDSSSFERHTRTRLQSSHCTHALRVVMCARTGAAHAAAPMRQGSPPAHRSLSLAPYDGAHASSKGTLLNARRDRAASGVAPSPNSAHWRMKGYSQPIERAALMPHAHAALALCDADRLDVVSCMPAARKCNILPPACSLALCGTDA